MKFTILNEVKHRNINRKSAVMASGRDKHRQKSKGKSLFGRIEPNQTGKAKRPSGKQGYTVVNGKLVSSNDVGALLRQAATTVERRKGHSAKKGQITVTQKSTNVKKTVKSRPTRPSRPSRPIKSHGAPNNLVISTNEDVSRKLLVFSNLELGVNHDNLKSVLEELSNASIARVRVRDLPSGSSTANVWLSRPTAGELERVRKYFDGALVDGRTIKVSTVPEASAGLSY